MNNKQLTFHLLFFFPLLIFSNSTLNVHSQVIKNPDTLNLVFTGDDAYAPFEYLDDNGKPAGFDVDVINSIAEVMGINMNIVLGDWYANYNSFREGEYDGLIGGYYTEERKKDFLIGTPYIRNYHAIFVRKGSPIHNLNDLQKLKKPKVITQNSDVLINYIKTYNNDADIKIVLNYEQALRLLALGEYDCAIMLRILGEYHIDKYAITNVVALQEDFLPREYSFIVHKKNEKLLSILNQGLEIVISTGKYDKLYNKHLKEFKKITVAEKYFKHILIGASILVLIIGLFYLHSYRLTKKVNQKTKLLAYELEKKKETHKLLMIERDKALESDKLKSAFLANLSHEIRTPMNAIVGFSRLLEEQNLSVEERSKYVEIINNNADVLLTMINDIIDLAKIECGQITLEKVDFCINSYINNFVETAKTELKARGKEGIKIITKTPLADDETIIHTDIVRFKQIFKNLISNAIKFTEKGYIKVGYSQPSSGYIRFFVEDTGVGISKSKQKFVFDQFRQADDSSTRKYGGTGLGLTICKELTQALGGEMTLESTVNIGTIVSFTIPFKKY